MQTDKEMIESYEIEIVTLRKKTAELIQTLRDLIGEVGPGSRWRFKCDVKKDFSLMVAHAQALKLLHRLEEGQ